MFIHGIDNHRHEFAIGYILLICFIYFIQLFFRFPFADELLYLRETSAMSRMFLNLDFSDWNGIGTHGFLFKLPVALIFLISGPSVIVANIFHIILALVSAFFFYKILLEIFNNKSYSLFGVIILISNYIFFHSTITYQREIPVLFSTIILLYCFIKKTRPIIIGLILILVLDAKEHVFLQLSIGLFLFLIFRFLSKRESGKNTIKIVVSFFGPPGFFLFLMFFSPIVPINTFAAYSMGLLKNGGQTIANSIIAQGDYGGTSFSIINNRTIWGKIFSGLNCKTLNRILKFFHPRMISMLSLPKIITVPAMFMTIRIPQKQKDKPYIEIFAFMFWSYFLIFFLTISHGRYLFSIMPILIIFFFYYLKERKLNYIYIVTIVTIFFGFLFEYNYLFIKVISNILLMFSIYIYFKSKNIKTQLLSLVLFTVILSTVTLSAAVASNIFNERGQIKQSIEKGYFGENKRISSYFYQNEKILTDSLMDAYMLSFYKQDFTPTYVIFGKQLKKIIPKKMYEPNYNNNIVFYNQFSNLESILEDIELYKIDKLLVYEKSSSAIIKELEDDGYIQKLKSPVLKKRRLEVYERIR